MKGRGLILLGLAALCLSVVWVLAHRTTPQQLMTVAPVVQRGTEVLQAADRVGLAVTRLSRQEEEEVGRRIRDRVLATVPPAADPEAEARRAYLEDLLLILRAKGSLRHTPQILLIDELAPNAFALPGGTVVVTSGMLLMADTEAELAGVLGHELAHVELGHVVERLQYERIARRLGGPLLEDLSALGYELYRRGYSARQEEEADRQGVRLAALAGYHPQAVRDLFLRMERLRAGGRPRVTSFPEETLRALARGVSDYLSTHPPTRERISALDRSIRELGLDLEARWYLGRANRKALRSRLKDEEPSEWVQGPLPEADGALPP